MPSQEIQQLIEAAYAKDKEADNQDVVVDTKEEELSATITRHQEELDAAKDAVQDALKKQVETRDEANQAFKDAITAMAKELGVPLPG